MNNDLLSVFTAQTSLKLPETSHEALYIICAIVFLMLALFILVVLYRKKPRRRLQQAHHHRRGNEAEGQALGANPDLANSGGTRKRRRSRRSKYPERPLNPTLAQTRGLPPLRDPSTPPAGL